MDSKRASISTIFVGALASALLVSACAQADWRDDLLSDFAIFRANTKDENLKFPGIAKSDGVPQHLTLVDSGVGALKKRMDMVESATQSIDVQYFIYSIDRAGRLFTQALIRKAQQGVKIRLLIDTSKAVFELNKMFVAEIEKQGIDKDGNHNIEVKYYNLDSYVDFVSLNFRAHRKVIIVDNRIAVTGGRNMADEYFGLSPKYNFLDSDMFVEGSIVPQMTIDFEDFWNAPIVSLPQAPTPPVYVASNGEDVDQNKSAYEYQLKKYQKNLATAHDYTVENQSDRDLMAQINLNGDLALKNTSFEADCSSMIYAADHPGIGARDATRVLSTVLINEVKEVATSDQVKNPNAASPNTLTIESPYFIPNGTFDVLLNELKTDQVGLDVMTNSLNSTDAFYTVAAFDQRVKPLLRGGAKIAIYDGSSASNLYTAEPKSQMARWGTHAKRAVIGDTVMVGTFNIDPRSNSLNAEMAVICENNHDLAQAVKNSIEFRKKEAYELNTDGNPANGKPRQFGTSFFKKIEYWVSYPFAAFLDFLL